MKVAIMQPYFLPYIGYWQLIASVDLFVIYDNIKYTKKGWINRNRFLSHGKEALFSLPLEKDSDQLDVKDRRLAKTFDRADLTSRFAGTYSKAPYFQSAMPRIEEIIYYESNNLFEYIYNSIVKICEYLEIKTSLSISSALPANHDLKSQSRVIDICKTVGATEYVNPLGGVDLYDSKCFLDEGIKLSFLTPKLPELTGPFVGTEGFSILHLMMHMTFSGLKYAVNENNELVKKLYL